MADDEIQYDEKAINKVLLKDGGVEILRIERERLAAMDRLDVKNVESTLHSLAEERQIGLGKVAQPLRVALCGSTISISIFDAVEILGKNETLARIDKALHIIETRPEI
jgi:glutamyl-tRNA synthetase